MISQEKLSEIIKLGEGYQAEFKSAVPSKVKELAEEICAFANAAGGLLLLGVNDNNEVCGVDADNKLLSRIQDAINEIKPRLVCQLQVVETNHKKIILVSVPSGDSKPYVLSGSVFVRMGPNTQKLTQPEELQGFFQQAGKIFFDEAPCKEATAALISEKFLDIFIQMAGIGADVDKKQLITNLKLLSNEKESLKNGAVLFFAEHPQSIHEHAVTRCVMFKDTTKRFILDDKKIEGNLFHQLQEAIRWLNVRLNVRYDIEGQGSQPRKEVWEIPEVVIKEALTNALAHRDYYDKGGCITVELYSDRLEISNPGGLVSAIPEKLFGKRSHSRNPLLFGLFARMRLVEQIGTGIPRMRLVMQEAKLPEPVFHFEGTFSVTLYRPVDFEKWVDAWAEKLSENRISILRLIRHNPMISKREMQNTIGISATAIDNNISFLKSSGLLSRLGGAKGGHWNIHYTKPDDG
jgi:ATP-dependent DNA helicase RecG